MMTLCFNAEKPHTFSRLNVGLEKIKKEMLIYYKLHDFIGSKILMYSFIKYQCLKLIINTNLGPGWDRPRYGGYGQCDKD